LKPSVDPGHLALIVCQRGQVDRGAATNRRRDARRSVVPDRSSRVLRRCRVLATDAEIRRPIDRSGIAIRHAARPEDQKKTTRDQFHARRHYEWPRSSNRLRYWDTVGFIGFIAKTTPI